MLEGLWVSLHAGCVVSLFCFENKWRMFTALAHGTIVATAAPAYLKQSSYCYDYKTWQNKDAYFGRRQIHSHYKHGHTHTHTHAHTQRLTPSYTSACHLFLFLNWNSHKRFLSPETPSLFLFLTLASTQPLPYLNLRFQLYTNGHINAYAHAHIFLSPLSLSLLLSLSLSLSLSLFLNRFYRQITLRRLRYTHFSNTYTQHLFD